jgi:glucose/arabinose dehydrogenase
MRSSRLAAAALAGVLTLGVAACSDDEPDNAPSDRTRTGSTHESATGVEATDLVTDLTSPWGVLVLDDGSLLVSERDTRQIKLVSADSPDRAEVVATIDEAVPSGEAGLLGLAATADESMVFAYYTSAEDNRIVAMTWDGATLGEPEVIFDGIPHGDGNRHEGGRMVVGPDDLLYIGTGETGSTPDIAQDEDSLGGKILRITVDGEPAPDNPFGTAVYSLGHRNVEGLAFDDAGTLWASEFGDSDWDELNLIEPGGNYGWPEVEGSGGGDEYVDPVAVWATEDASPSGLAHWDGSLWLAGLRGERLWEIPVDDTDVGTPVPHLAGELGRLRTVETNADGSGLLLATSNTDGRGEPRDGDDRILAVTR